LERNKPEDDMAQEQY